MSQGADRRARDLRVYAVLCSAGTTFGIVAAVLSWRAAMPGVGVLFLVLSGLLVPISLLLSRDAQRRRTPLGGSGSGRPAPAPAGTSDGGDRPGEIVVTRPKGFYQDVLRRYDVRIDGQTAGRLERGEELRRTVDAGGHDVAAKIDWTGSPTLRVVVPPGGTVTVTVTPGSPLSGLFSSDQYLELSVDGD